jgi:hypothetical protein
MVVELHVAIDRQLQISAILLPEAGWVAYPVLILRRSKYVMFLTAKTHSELGGVAENKLPKERLRFRDECAE